MKIYDHRKDATGRWLFVPMAISLDTRSTKYVQGAFKISWYARNQKRFSRGHFPYLADAIRAGKAKQLELQDGNGEQMPLADSRKRIDDAAILYLEELEKNSRPGTLARATETRAG